MKKIQQKFTPKEEGTMAMKQNYTDKAKLRKKTKNKQKITPTEESKWLLNRATLLRKLTNRKSLQWRKER